MGFTGAAIDYSRANAIKVAMQAALDSTGAHPVEERPRSVAAATLGSRSASAIFNAQFNRPEAQNVSISMCSTRRSKAISRSS